MLRRWLFIDVSRRAARRSKSVIKTKMKPSSTTVSSSGTVGHASTAAKTLRLVLLMPMLLL